MSPSGHGDARHGFCSVETIGRDQLWLPLRGVCDAVLAGAGVFVLVVRGGADVADHSLLGPGDRERSVRLWHARDRANLILGRTMIHHLVRARGARGPVALELGPHGKPALQRGPHFNLAHSADFVACAVCSVGVVGIDVEAFERPGSVDELFARVAHPREAAVRAAAPAPRRRELFERAWTRKEAALKAAGLGLSVDPRSIDVDLRAERPLIADPAPLRLVDLDLSPWPVAGALAVVPAAKCVRVRLLDLVA